MTLPSCLRWGPLALAALPLLHCVDAEQVLFAPGEGGSGAGPSAGGAPPSGGNPPALGGSSPTPQPGPVGEVVRVDAGDTHTCATVDGQLFCWGDNSSGELGLGDFASRSTPTRVGQEEGWSQPGAGAYFSCALLDGNAQCWGRGSSGQLGNGAFAERSVPSPVLAGGIAQLAVGHEHACAVSHTGQLSCWGNNTEGQLGQDDPFPSPGVSRAEPVQVGSHADWASVTAGQGHTCGIRAPGRLFCWGRNGQGELGLGASAAQQLRNPERVGTAEDWDQVVAGQNHTCGIRNRELLCWGDSGFGQLGIPGEGAVLEPATVDLGEPVASVALDTFHTCARLTSGDARCFGRNAEGQLGDPDTRDRLPPTPLLPAPWDQISPGRFHTCAVKAGATFCSGENSDGRLGVGDVRRRSTMSATLAFF